ncbi:DUF1361 domain-containing protein [Nicoliella lavandulae]|uniref:DUF1361 domain-containing protein n=1 Tax=Nicoliella lavandulae TaxID=3082954 RepID=A0ABU8SKJ1_9LACO
MHLAKRWQIRIFFLIWFGILAVFSKQPFGFLLLNTFLAYIPIEIGFHLHQRTVNASILYWPILFLWIVFYPNAPYILTDLFHLSLLSPYDQTTGLLRLSTPMWIDYLLLTISALVSAFVGAWSLSETIKSLMNKLHCKSKFIYGLLVLLMTFTASVGVFIGRFLRLHTIYLLLSPRLFIMPLVRMWTPDMLIFTGVMTILQLVIYWLIIINQRPKIETK